MVSIVVVEIFGFLPFSNWPDFDQKFCVESYISILWEYSYLAKNVYWTLWPNYDLESIWAIVLVPQNH